jgi:hypothetical protein
VEEMIPYDFFRSKVVYSLQIHPPITDKNDFLGIPVCHQIVDLLLQVAQEIIFCRSTRSL